MKVAFVVALGAGLFAACGEPGAAAVADDAAGSEAVDVVGADVWDVASSGDTAEPALDTASPDTLSSDLTDTAEAPDATADVPEQPIEDLGRPTADVEEPVEDTDELPKDVAEPIGDGITDPDDVDTTEPQTSPLAGLVVVNELLIDADTDTLLDPNDDGDLSAVDDEFIELLNVSGGPVDLSGCTIVEQDLPSSPRHTFAVGTLLGSGAAIVVFGGGEAPAPIPGAEFVSATNTDPGFSFGLHLSDSGNQVRLLDATGLEVLTFVYGSVGGHSVPENQSLTRSPDGSGEFLPHTSVDGGAIFSPGTRADGSAFGP